MNYNSPWPIIIFGGCLLLAILIGGIIEIEMRKPDDEQDDGGTK